LEVDMRITVLALLVCVIFSANIFADETSARITPVVKVIREWSSSVVNIGTEQIVLLRTNPFFGQFNANLNLPGSQIGQPVGTMNLKSVGSGVVVSKDGLILTNGHVVQMASKIYVTLSDGKQTEASLEALNPDDDLAIIKIKPPENLKPVNIADDVMIGETVVTIGNPFGLENSVSAGIISGLNRDVGGAQPNSIFTGLIQTDAAINQGSSGGGLLNLDGKLVGINLALVQNVNSIGFAIPYTKIKKMLKDYREGKFVIKTQPIKVRNE
jgi:serine protease Do